MTGAWHDGRLTILDLETTAADPDTARIVSACVGEVGGGEASVIATLVAQPDGFEIPMEAAAIHGFSTSRAQLEGRPIREVLEIVLGCLADRPEGSPVVGFNVAYDLTVLTREAERYDLPVPGTHRQLRVVDPFVIDRHLDRYRRGSRKLAAVCEHHKVRLDGAHRAEHDAISAGRLAWVLARKGCVIRQVRNAAEGRELDELRHEWDAVRDDLELLHSAQVGWAKTQAEGLQAHFRKQGKQEAVPTEWPVRPRRLSLTLL